MTARLALATLLAVAALPGAAVAAPTVDLRTTPSFEIVGAHPQDFAGEAVASAGDVNGDGIDDVLIAAPSANGPEGAYSGAVYVVFGRRGVPALPRAQIAADGGADTQGFRIDGPAADGHAGTSVASVGDVNGDGLDDVIVGVPDDGPDVPRSNGIGGVYVHAGAAYVVFGKKDGTAVDLAHLGDQGVEIAGAPAGRVQLGTQVAGGRDVNGDGHPDVVVSDMTVPYPLVRAPKIPPRDRSSAYVIFGGALRGGQVLHVDRLGGAGYRIDAHFLGTLSLAADMNGDHRAEVVVGEEDGSYGNRNVAYVAFGRAGTKTMVLEQLGAHGGFAIRNDRKYSEQPRIVGGDDVNGDGRGDLVAATYTLRGKRSYAGVAEVLFGGPSGRLRHLERPGQQVLRAIGPTVPMVDNGRHRNRYILGPNPLRDVAIVPDADGDGRADVLAGGFASPHDRFGAGSAFLFRAPRAGTTELTAKRAPGVVRIDGAYADDSFGSTVAPAGDFDGDHRPDLLIGGFEATRNGRPNAGVAWVLSGVRP
ncbi:integrin alpha [Conexibacter woesei]|uniref:integrin alpha n=1 Tax=Conexibacter woesei TaxID=191495 RepID=UPI00047CB4E8|nr:integrin alpha [Conexibacter woesei]